MNKSVPTMEELDEMFEEYLNQFRSAIPWVDVAGDTRHAMRDAFIQGAQAILLRNAPIKIDGRSH